MAELLDMAARVVFWVSLGALYYIYDGYLRLLSLWSLCRGTAPGPAGRSGPPPRLTVLLTVHNEAEAVIGRIENILANDYPAESLEVLVASDGSTDGTDDLVTGFGDPRVRLFRTEGRLGKSETQKQALLHAAGEIIVFTDAGTVFARDFLAKVVQAFADPRVGGVDGHLLIISDPQSCVSASQGLYWRRELRMRRLESDLGFLAVASGACLAVRREYLRPLPEDVGEDCVVPLDVVGQGARMVHAEEALAYDTMNGETAGEFRARVRMTHRNVLGTWRYRKLLNPLTRPGYALALWSHKMMRWMSPLFLVGLTIAACWLAGRSLFYTLSAAGLALFYIAGLLGCLASRRGARIPVAGTIFSFLLANLGFAYGLARALSGGRVTGYH
ncbi:MAG: glycosyltransferase [Thermodesulfobacteriota bacterium]